MDFIEIFCDSGKFGPMALKLQPEVKQSSVNEVSLLKDGMEPYVVSCLWFGSFVVGITRYSGLLQRREKPFDELLKDICQQSGPTEKALHVFVQSVFFEVADLFRSLVKIGLAFKK